MTHLISATNVNDAFRQGAQLITDRAIVTETRAGKAYAVPDMVVTTYALPCQRVLWCPTRDANPFFHFFEALWILNGQQDVATLAKFNSRMAEYSDDGEVFHAPYGYRLRHHFGFDQIEASIHKLGKNMRDRQVVMSIWDPTEDMVVVSKDIPCNDIIKLRADAGVLDMTVFCRSNDMIWGAYGANVVQFSTLQEYIAGALSIPVGTYSQVSCDFHVYEDTKAKMSDATSVKSDPYFSSSGGVLPFPMFEGCPSQRVFDEDLEKFMIMMFEDIGEVKFATPYFAHVAAPMYTAWMMYKQKQKANASLILEKYCAATDWRLACLNWLSRR